jgi:hypothetical protein
MLRLLGVGFGMKKNGMNRFWNEPTIWRMSQKRKEPKIK